MSNPVSFEVRYPLAVAAVVVAQPTALATVLPGPLAADVTASVGLIRCEVVMPALVPAVVVAPGGGSSSPGAPGADAYEVAVAEGFVGTRAEWLVSLRGVPGTPGTNGTNGTDGVGKSWVNISLSAYLALSAPVREDAGVIYNVNPSA